MAEKVEVGRSEVEVVGSTTNLVEPTKSATERLRALLDERGVEYLASEDSTTIYYADSGYRYTYNVNHDSGWAQLYGYHLTPEQAVEATMGRKVTGETSDGYHTFDELYHHRAVLFSVIVRDHRELAWKSKAHHDGTMYDGMFIVGIETPQGQATYHYDIDPYWDMFDCKELDRAPEWDGHTPDDAIGRIATLGLTEKVSEKDSDECHADETDVIKCWVKCKVEPSTEHMELIHVMECSACGGTYEHVNGAYEYCPRCGKRVKEEE